MAEPSTEFKWLRDATDGLLDSYNYKWIAILSDSKNDENSPTIISHGEKLSDLIYTVGNIAPSLTAFYAFIRPRLEPPDKQRD